MRQHNRTIAGMAGCLVLLLGTAAIAEAASPAEDRAAVKSAESAIRKAGTLYRAKKFAAAGESLVEAQEVLDRLGDGSSRELAGQIKPLRAQLAKARDLLAVEGIKLPAARATGDAPSFTRQIAPLLVARCGACHVARARGELSMATYVALAKGSKDGTIIMPGDAEGSRIIEVIVSGDMPRGDGKVSADELALLSRWIAAGAKFDGTDPAAPLTSYAAAAPAAGASEGMADVMQATGREAVQFARDLGPVLLAQCIECHGGDNPRNNFSMATFARLMRGGDSGRAIEPGKPADSLLLKKLRGTAGTRMPLDGTPLADDVIAKFEKWIALGSPYDGPTAETSLADVVALKVAERSTSDELSRTRAELAAKNWRLMLPDSPPRREESDQVLVMGHVSQELLAEVARTADEQAARIRKLFKVTGDGPLVKGRLTLFVFDKRYDYAEAGTMLEQRDLPATLRGHWRFTGVDAYGCLLVSDERVSPALVAQVVGGAYIASLGKVPRWFAEGWARALASRVDAKDPRVKLWDDQAPRILATSPKPDSFLTGNLSPEEVDTVSYGFVKYLMSSGGRYTALIAALGQGAAFETAFAKQYGGTPNAVATTWAAKPAKRGR